LRDFVGRRARVGDGEVEHGFDPDDHVVFGDHRLGGEVDDLLAQVNERLHPIDERGDDRQTGLQRAAVATEPLHHPGPRLGDHADAARGSDQRKQN